MRGAGSRLAVYRRARGSESRPEGGHFSRVQWLKRLAQRRDDRVAFVFSGGGPLGALQVGALKALVERGVLPDLVVGTSVGALNAAVLAFEPSTRGARRLESVWHQLAEDDLFPGSRFMGAWGRMLRRGDRIFDNSGMTRLIQTILGEGATFDDAQIPLGIVTTELMTGEERVFTSGPIQGPLLASSAMPRRYIDGGVVDNVPIAPAIELGANTIYVLDTTSRNQPPRPLIRPMDYLMHAFSLARAQRLVVERPMVEAERVKLVMLPTAPLDFFVPFTSLRHTRRLIELSYDHTSQYLESITGPGAPTEHSARVVLEAVPRWE
jgi:NTE family protein